MEFTSKQVQAIENALRIAIEQYKVDAYNMHCAGLTRVAEQFRAQYDEAQAILRAIENA